MRIALVSYEFPPDTGKGGIGTYTIQLALLLASNNFDVHVFAGTNKPSYDEELQRVHIHRVYCSGREDFKINVVPVFSQEQDLKAFQIIESPEIHGNAWGIKNAFPLIPLVIRLHAPNYLVEHLKKKYTSLFSKLRFVLGALRRGKIDLGYWRKYDYLNDADFQFTKIADAVTAPSETMKQWAVKHWKLLPEDITVIVNPFIPAKALLDIPINEKVSKNEIVFFGRLNVLKGLVNATLATKKILVEFPNWHFTIIGDDGAGPKRNESMGEWMRNHFKKVKHQVVFISGQSYEQLPNFLTNASIVLLPSLFESFSYTCAEAMAAGKAVIGSRNTAMKDLIKQHDTGVLINADSVNSIYNALKKLIQNNQFRYDISVAARESVATTFGVEMIMPKFISFYTSIIASRG